MILNSDRPLIHHYHELLPDLQHLALNWDQARSTQDLVSALNQLLSSCEHAAGQSQEGLTARRRRMSAPRYQKGSIEKTGDWYYVRFRRDIPGRKTRKKERERICPIKGPGSLNEKQREVRAQQIVDASGVNDAFFANCGRNRAACETLRERGDAWLRDVAKRKRKPVATRTLDKWRRSLTNWWYPTLGKLPISEVNNSTVKPLITKMAESLKPSTIGDHLQVVKHVVASAVDKEGEPLYLRKWNHAFMDVPCVDDRETDTPVFSVEIMSGLARWKNKRTRTLFTLCGASGLRIGEALGLDLEKHFSDDFRTIRIEQKALKGKIETRLKTTSSYREIDLDPRAAQIVRDFASGRTSGLLFRTRTGKPLTYEFVLRSHLHPALKALGFVNPLKGNHYAGTHAFRRFRETHLGKVEGLPRGIRLFWMGHAEENMTDHYDKIREDRATRREWAERCGVGFDLPECAQVVPITAGLTSALDAA